jgi:hypothetical protein
MADPTKELDRLRPFKRINNQKAIPDAAPDGLGVNSGCHVPEDLGNLTEAFRKFLEDRPGALGTLFTALNAAKQVARAAAEVAAIADRIRQLALAVSAAAAAAGAALGAGIGGVILALVTIANVLTTVSAFVNGVLDAIDTGLKEFMVRIGAALAERAIRRIPQWVPVEDTGNRDRITAAQVREVEGIVARSYCDPLGTPFFQWQTWLSWSIQVRPEPDYRTLRVDGFQFSKDLVTGQPLVDPATVEIQWDMGALNVGGEGPGIYARKLEGKKTEAELTAREAPFFQSTRVFSDSENNWLWPTAGMYVWASGRWVYDCSRPDRVKADRTNPPKMYTMLNPVRAMATASWEAFGFPENTPTGVRTIRNAVPAIRFMFIASQHGGHLDHPTIADEDYEFILDLPPPPEPPSPFPVGHTLAHKRTDGVPDFPQNTIVLRPMLLRDLRRPFSNSNNVRLVTPVIELLQSAKGPGVVEQVKLTVPAGQLGRSKGHAGFLLSLGWFDPNLERANTAKSARVQIDAMRGRLSQDRDTPVETLRKLFDPELKEIKKKIVAEIAKIKLPIIPGNPTTIDELINNPLPEPLHSMVAGIAEEIKRLALTMVDKTLEELLNLLAAGVGGATTEECMFHFGVNGRWTSRYLDLERNVRQDFKSPQGVPNPVDVEVVLGPDDALHYASSGVEWNPVGNIMFEAQADRMLQGDGGAVNWSQISRASGTELRDLAFEYALQILKGGSGAGIAMGIENDPIGVKQPQALDKPDGTNPIGMRNAQPGDVDVDRAASTFAHAEGRQSVLSVEVPAQKDYVLEGTVHIAKQFPK